MPNKRKNPASHGRCAKKIFCDSNSGSDGGNNGSSDSGSDAESDGAHFQKQPKDADSPVKTAQEKWSTLVKLRKVLSREDAEKKDKRGSCLKKRMSSATPGNEDGSDDGCDDGSDGDSNGGSNGVDVQKRPKDADSTVKTAQEKWSTLVELEKMLIKRINGDLVSKKGCPRQQEAQSPNKRKYPREKNSSRLKRQWE